LKPFGPTVAGGRQRHIQFDFAGDSPSSTGQFRNIGCERHGALDWPKTSFCGQVLCFFVPNNPLRSRRCVPALAYFGNPLDWAPQIRIDTRLQCPVWFSLLIQGGYLIRQR